MQTVSATWTSLLSGSYTAEFKCVINGVTYDHASIASVSITKLMMDSLSIGNACSATLEMQFRPSGTIPTQAQIQCYVRLTDNKDLIVVTDENGNVIKTDDNYVLASQYPSYSEWIPFGTFRVDERKTDEYGWMTVTAYDAMMMAEQMYSISGTYPMASAAVVANICTKLGITQDSRNSITSYSVPDPNGLYTIREVLQQIAASNGGNFVITESGQLRLVKLASATASASVKCESCDTLGNTVTISKVNLVVDNKTTYTSGTGTGYALTADCPFATQAMANAVKTALSGVTYLPVKASRAIVSPAIEIGDPVNPNGKQTVLANVTFAGGGMLIAEISAPSDGEVNHEFPYLSSAYKALKTKIIEATKAAASAANDAAAAQNRADSAYSLASSANNNAADANDKIEAFQYSGSEIQINGANLMADTVTASRLRGGEVELITSSENTAGYISLTGSSSSNYAIVYGSNGAVRLMAESGAVYIRDGSGSYLQINGDVSINDNFRPSSPGSYYLGTSSYYWSTAYLGSAAVVVSDRDKKKDIDYGFDKFDEFFNSLRPATFKYKDGTSGRTHHGLIAQDVEDAMKNCGIDDFAGLVKSQRKDGNGFDFALRYEELIPMLIDQVQRLKRHIDDLEKGKSE